MRFWVFAGRGNRFKRVCFVEFQGFLSWTLNLKAVLWKRFFGVKIGCCEEA